MGLNEANEQTFYKEFYGQKCKALLSHNSSKKVSMMSESYSQDDYYRDFKLDFKNLEEDVMDA